MLFLLSPAKSLDYDRPAPAGWTPRAPAHLDRSAELIGQLRPFSAQALGELMSLSPALSQLNVDRYRAWQPDHRGEAVRPAVLAFNGDVYEGLDAASLDDSTLDWLDQHLLILSGLYGALQPMDALRPYRLEMGTRLKNGAGNDLYAFWGTEVAERVQRQAASAPEGEAPWIVNLASEEYAKVVKGPKARKAVSQPMLDLVFEDWKGNGYKIISFHAKRARGLMMRHAALTRAKSPQDLQGFDLEGYRFAPESSDELLYVFRRKQD